MVAPTKPEGTIRVAVIGGGIAGLTAALELTKRGFDVAVFESDVNLGGKLGANPGRLPMKDLLEVKPGIGKNNVKDPSARVAEDRTLDSKQLAFVRKTLSSGRLPVWIRRLLDTRLKRRHLTLVGTAEKLAKPPKIGNGACAFSCDQRMPDGSYRTITRSLSAVHTSTSLRRKADDEEPPETWSIKAPLETRLPTSNQPIQSTLPFRITFHQRLNETIVIDINDDVPHEHCYHMYMNWYVNFWRLIEEVGVEKSTHFEPRNQYVHLFPGSDDISRRTRTLDRLGSPECWGENLLSGVASVPDAFLGMYSVLDLASRPLNPDRYLDRQSVHAFLSSRWYATEESLKLHEYLLVRAFAVPTYFGSAYAYQKYLSFTLASPEPALWILKGDTESQLFHPFGEALKTLGCALHLGHRVTRFGFDGAGRVRDIVFRPSDMRWPRSRYDGERMNERAGPEQEASFTPHYVILAVPPRSLADIVSDFRHVVPGLSRVRKLQSGVTAVLDLHFTRDLAELEIPSDHVILRNSRYGLTFFDNSQLWFRTSDGKKDCTVPTCLSIAVTDFYRIEGMSKDDAMREIIEDLQRFVPFQLQDIDLLRTYLHMNVNEPLFLNEVGSEPWRPGTCTEVPNLFIAGDFCQTEIEVVCIEGAVVSGLMAAQAVQAQLRADNDAFVQSGQAGFPPNCRLFEDIEILQPASLSPAKAEAMKAMVANHLPMAKAASRVHELRKHPERAFSMGDAHAAMESMFDMPASMGKNAIRMQTSAAEWLTTLPTGPF